MKKKWICPSICINLDPSGELSIIKSVVILISIQLVAMCINLFK